MTPWVLRLLVANVAMFALDQLYPFVGNLLAFYPQAAFSRPWGWFTYMFVHGGPGHIFWNMLGLFFFGPRVETRMGGTRFIQMYVIAGLTGALFQFIMVPQGAMIGASGALFGVMMAFAMFWPRERIYIWGVIPVEAWLLVVIYTGWSLYAGLGRGGNIAHFAHLGGYAGAYVFLWAMEKYSPANRFRARVNRVAPTTEKVLQQNWKNVNLEGVHQLSREEVNRILDKINAEGIGSLTSEEKLFLSNFVPPDDRKSWTQ